MDSVEVEGREMSVFYVFVAKLVCCKLAGKIIELAGSQLNH